MWDDSPDCPACATGWHSRCCHPDLAEDGDGELVERCCDGLLIALAEGEAEILAVKVAGQPSQAIRQGHPVKVTGLVAQPWSMNDRAGVAFRAARIEPAVAQAKAS